MDSRTKHYFISPTNQRIIYKLVIQKVWELGQGMREFQIGSITPNGISIEPYFKNIIDTHASFFIENVDPKPSQMSEKDYLLNCNRRFITYCSQQIAQDIAAEIQQANRQQMVDEEDEDHADLIADVFDDGNDDPLDDPVAAADESGSDLDERMSRIQREREKELRPIHKTGKMSEMKRKQLSRTSVISRKNLNAEQKARKKASATLRSKKQVKFNKNNSSESDDSESNESSENSDSESDDPVELQSKIQNLVSKGAKYIGNGGESDSSEDEDEKKVPVQNKKKNMVIKGGKKVVSQQSDPTPVVSSPPKQKPKKAEQKPVLSKGNTQIQTVLINIDTRSIEGIQNLAEYKVPFAYNRVKQIQLVGAEIPKTGYNITKFNNRLCFEEEEGKPLEISITPGYYHTFDSIKRAVEEQMRLVGNGMYSLSEDPKTRIVRITASSNPGSTRGVHLFNLDWTRENSLVDILGFPHSRQQGELSYKGTKCYSFRGESYVLLQIPEFGARFSDGKTFSKVVLDVPEGEMKYYSPRDDSITFPSPKNFKEITIRFNSFNDRIYNFHDQHHSLTFQVSMFS